MVECTDNNDIDREVTRFRPDVVVIEALWVVPSKFYVLKRLHPTVRWSVHLHSHIPFLALEGIAIEWIRECADKGVKIIANNVEEFRALEPILNPGDIVYLPNVYISKPRAPVFSVRDQLNVACFGAVRPLKNQLLQALAAIKYSKANGKTLAFHVNSSRMETGGEPVMKNLVALFADGAFGTLVQHPWYEPDQFIDVLQGMDIGLQVSLTETFNVVTADYITAGLPIVVSKEVEWVSRYSKAADNAVDSITDRMECALKSRARGLLVTQNQKLLAKNSALAQKMWFDFCQGF